MLNKVLLIGRLGRDPDVRHTQSGMPIATLNIATDEVYTDRDGKRQERTEWHRVIAFQRLAELCSSYLTKGRLVFVEGSLQTRKWQDQEGKDRYTTEIRAQTIKFIGRSDDRGAYPEDQDYRQPAPGYQSKGRPSSPSDDFYADEDQPPYQDKQRNGRSGAANDFYSGSRQRQPGRSQDEMADEADMPSEASSSMDEVPF